MADFGDNILITSMVLNECWKARNAWQSLASSPPVCPHSKCSYTNPTQPSNDRWLDGTHSDVVNSWFAGPNFTKFLHKLKKSLPFNILKSILRSCNHFWNVSVPNEIGVGQFTTWPHNWLPWQRPLSDHKMNERLLKPSRTSTNTENLVQIGPVDSETTWR